MLIEAAGYDLVQKQAQDFFNQLIKAGKDERLSYYALTFSIMYCVKINELASEFYDHQGIAMLSSMLVSKCLNDYQLAYNVLVSLWILSFHDYARTDFEDMEKDLIERCLKILDFFNKEKVVRMTLHLLDSLSSSRKCLEIMSDLSCLDLITKL